MEEQASEMTNCLLAIVFDKLMFIMDSAHRITSILRAVLPCAVFPSISIPLRSNISTKFLKTGTSPISGVLVKEKDTQANLDKLDTPRFRT